MNTQRDKFLTEQVLGESVHVIDFISTDVQGGSGDGYYACSVCHKSFDNYRGHCPNANNFSTPEGFFKLWNAAKEKDWWYMFVITFSPQYCDVAQTWLSEFIHPDRFAKALEAFLKEREL